MKNWHRDTKCLNCETTYEKNVNFCPTCGQRNTTSKLSTKELLNELFDILFNLNTRITRSIIPFLFKPAKLTKDFIAGKRVKYVHPIRLYLFMSILFFFVLTTGSSFDGLINIDNQALQESISIEKQDSVMANMNQLIQEASESNVLDSTTLSKLQGELNALDESRRERVQDSLNIGLLTDTLFINWDKLNNVWAKDPMMTPSLLLDSIGYEDKNFFSLLIAKQLLKYGKNHNTDDITKKVIDNIPIMMIFLLPIFALNLKILYIRKKYFYIEHLIFALHIHAFVYFLGTIGLLAYHLFDTKIALYLIGINLVYSFMMFLRMYQQNWFKTWFKMCILGFCYLFLLVIGSSFEVIISLLTF